MKKAVGLSMNSLTGTFLSYINFCTQFEVNISFLIYHGLKNTIIKNGQF